MERLVRIAAVLKVAGDRGVSADKLVRVAGFDGERRDGPAGRELRHLRNQGWQIDNIADRRASPAATAWSPSTTACGSRLTPAQQRALQRAVLLADRQELGRPARPAR